MTLSYVGHGITDNGTLSIRVNYPTTVLKNDLLIARIGAHPDTTTITTFSGWTAITNGSGTGGTGTQGAGTGAVKTALYFKVAAGGETGNQDWTTSGLSCAISYMHQFRSTYNNGLYRLNASNGPDNTTGATWSVTGGQSLACVPSDILLACATHPDGSANPAWSADSLTGCGTFAVTGPAAQAGSTAGNDCDERDQIFTCTVAGSGAPVHGATIAATNTNVAGAEVFLQVQEIPSDPLLIEQQALNRSYLY